MNILQTLRDRFSAALAGLADDPRPFAEMVRPAQDAKFGDYQANCAMPLAKVLGQSPRDVAQTLVSRLDVANLCEPPEIAGPGFINLRVRGEWLRQRLQAVANDERLGVAASAEPRTIVIDFSGPNVAKPMHVGHLRSTVIGDALIRVLRFQGHTVYGDNHIGDWGTQFGMIIYGYKHFLDTNKYAADPVGELARLYRLVNTLCDYQEARAALPKAQAGLQAQEESLARQESAAPADPKEAKEQQKLLKKLRKDLEAERETVRSTAQTVQSIEHDAEKLALASAHPDIVRLSREETAKLHAGDAENRRLWGTFLPQCLAALERIYQRLSVTFDMTLGESYYDDRLAGVVADLQRRGLAVESGGAQCVFIEGNPAPFLVRKGDGAYTYATTDLATIQYRVEELHADEILYVVDHRQSEHFKLLFATAAVAGFDKVTLRHVPFGTVMGKDGKPYKTRSGDTVGLESLLDEAIAKARQIVAENDDRKVDEAGTPTPELSESQRDAIAEVVGIGGIKYADLKHNRESDYVFDYDKMLAMTGDTATYMQYAYARLCGIFRKGNVDRDTLRNQTGPLTLDHPAERALVLELCRFAEALSAVAAESKPNLLTQYLFELSGKLSTFYEECPVLKAESPLLRESRLRLVDLTGRVIRRGLELLGIGVCEQL
jgi:arginyl-tRNA synthetase